MIDYQAPADLLKGKTILITGAGDGIGKAVALAYAAHGATVILLGRTVKKLEAVYDEIIANKAPKPAIYPMDLTHATADDFQELGQRIGYEFGQIDGVLHNAAELGNLAPIDHYDIKKWYTIMQTNLNAPFLLTQAILPLLKKANQASLIFTAAQYKQQGKAYWGAYGVSKSALLTFAQTLADELEKTNIRVNCINPGPTRTKLRLQAYPAENVEEVPTPEVVLPTYLYLMGSDSKDIRGQCLDAQ